ncbi:MAG: LysR family transcriptional regulator [Pseudomonadales bacterium]
MQGLKNWENLRYYLAVARQGTVTGAAKRLGVSHATVLRRIDQVESELGARLFKKLQTGYVLTTTGRGLLDSVTELERTINTLVNQVQNTDSTLSGNLRVTQPGSSAINLYPLFAEFTRRYPEINLQIMSESRAANLNQQEADVAFRLTESPPELLVGRCIGTLQFQPYGSRSYLAQFEPGTKINRYQWVLWDYKDGVAWFEENVKDANVVMRASNLTDVLSAVRAGVGVGLLSHQVAQQYNDLQHVPAPNSGTPRKVWMLTHRDLRDVARVKVFMQFIAEEFHNQLAAIEPAPP